MLEDEDDLLAYVEEYEYLVESEDMEGNCRCRRP